MSRLWEFAVIVAVSYTLFFIAAGWLGEGPYDRIRDTNDRIDALSTQIAQLQTETAK